MMRTLATALAVIAWSAAATVSLPGARTAAADPEAIRCDARAELPRIEHVTVAKWSPRNS